MGGRENKDKVTTKDIAARLGVSTATVHRAIYGKPGVGEKLRKKILKEVEAAHYVIDGTASLMRRDEMKMAVLLPPPVDENRFFFRGIWSGIREAEEELKKQKITLEYVENRQGINYMGRALETLYDSTDSSLQGLVTMCDDDDSSGWVNRFSRRGTQVVLVLNSDEDTEALCSLKASHRDMGALAAHVVNLMLAGKEEQVLCINGSGIVFSCKKYLRGFYENLAEHLTYSEMLESDINEYEGKLRQVLAEAAPPVIFCSSARTTYHVCRIVKDMGLSGKVKIVGTDVFRELIPYFEDGTLLASIYQSGREQGRRALQILSRKLSGVAGEGEQAVVDMPIGVVMKENYRFFVS